MALPWHAVWDSPRPHVHPLRTLGGRVLTVDAPVDHPWHHGLWSTIKFVNGENFWEEYGEFGVLVTVDVSDEESTTTARIDWTSAAGTIVVREVRTLAHVALDDGVYALDWRFTLEPVVHTEFDRTPFTTWGGYGGLTLRGAPEWHDTSLRLPDGNARDRLLGEPAPWCALSNATATVALLDHPANVRFPTPWYASNRAETYGEGWANFVNAAFLWEGPLHVPAGATLDRRQRVIVADGPLTTGELSTRFEEWACT